MKGLLYILVAYLLGEGVSLLVGKLIPGSVVGMLLLFVALQTRLIKVEDVKQTATFLLDNMLLFFIPVCVGLMVSYQIIGEHLIPIAVILVVVTFAVLTVVGVIQQKLGERKDDKSEACTTKSEGEER